MSFFFCFIFVSKFSIVVFLIVRLFFFFVCLFGLSFVFLFMMDIFFFYKEKDQKNLFTLFICLFFFLVYIIVSYLE